MSSTRSNQRIRRWLQRCFTPTEVQSATSPQPDADKAPARRRVVNAGDDCCGISDVGLVRPANEDGFFIAREQGLLVLADGLGGHAAGEVAAEIAIASVRATVARVAERDDPVALLDQAFAEADGAVHEHARLNPECNGMGATLVVALLRGDELALAHVGDTRAYHCREGTLVRLTQDHSAVGRLLRAGLLDEEAARHHPARNQIDQAIGGLRTVAPEHVRVSLIPGDVLLLCSDGLWDEVSHSDMAGILADDAPAFHLATRLVDKAIAAGGNDNATVIVYRHSHAS